MNSCMKNDNSIEIYLLNERVETNEGVSLDKIKEYVENRNTFSKTFIDGTRYDTIKHEFIFAGKFEVKESQINKDPFIFDAEIESLDIVNGKILFSESGYKKIKAIKPDMIHGVQFVICNNKKPIFTGYFWNKYSSYVSTWNCLEYDHFDKKAGNQLEIYKGNGIDKIHKSKIDFNQYKDFVNAFKESNRLNK